MNLVVTLCSSIDNKEQRTNRQKNFAIIIICEVVPFVWFNAILYIERERENNSICICRQFYFVILTLYHVGVVMH